MEPQLKKGDFLLVNKFAYGLKVNRIGIPNFLKSDPQYGDAVVIIPPHNPVPYIKRLIGKPGDTIRIINKQIYINGTALDRSFIDTEEIIIKKRYKYSSGEIVEREMEAVGDLYSEKHGEAEYLIRHTRGEIISILKSGQFLKIIILLWETIEIILMIVQRMLDLFQRKFLWES